MAKKRYEVRVPFSGYVRGDFVHEVEADSESEALKLASLKSPDYEDIVRDDRTTSHSDAEVTSND